MEVIVKPIEAYRAASAPAAYYYSAPADGSRPGVFYLNTQGLAERLLYNQEALAYHEAIPGHHLQLSLAAEAPGLSFRASRDCLRSVMNASWTW